MKVAIVHDWLTGMRGGEKVLESFCELFPDSTIFTLLYKKGTVSGRIEKMNIKTSFIQHLPGVAGHYRNYLPLFPKAIENFDLRGFDLVLSSSHCVAKGVKIPKGSLHICYCYTPMRYIWVFFEQYFGGLSFFKKKTVNLIGSYLKKWDLSTSVRVNEFISISNTVRNRIKEIYNRESIVIVPPVDTEKFKLNKNIKKEDFYLCVSALVPYKRIDIIVEAFNKLKDRRIKIAGTGNIAQELKNKVKSGNIEFLGWVKDSDLIELYQKARAFVYAAEEDFGIAPVEAQASGLPVIAFGKGGATETVVPYNSSEKSNATGIFFFEQSAGQLITAIKQFEAVEKEFNPERIRENALKFSKESFKKNIEDFIKEKTGGQTNVS